MLMGEAAKHCMPAVHKVVARKREIRGVTPNKRVLHAINLMTGLQAQGRVSNKARIKHIISKAWRGQRLGLGSRRGASGSHAPSLLEDWECHLGSSPHTVGG